MNCIKLVGIIIQSAALVNIILYGYVVCSKFRGRVSFVNFILYLGSSVMPFDWNNWKQSLSCVSSEIKTHVSLIFQKHYVCQIFISGNEDWKVDIFFSELDMRVI
jgi:hypothetical protein